MPAECPARPSPLEPVVVAAVPQDHLASLGLPLSPLSVLGWTALARRGDSCTAQYASNRLPRYLNPLDLHRLLREVLVIEADVLASAQRQHSLTDLLRRPVLRAAPRVAMNQPCGAAASKPLPHPLDLAP